jgi:hypothetical protein
MQIMTGKKRHNPREMEEGCPKGALETKQI